MAYSDEINANPFAGFFWANDPNINQQLRQRIALAMMVNKQKYPKTLGEGLSAIGEAIGDRGIARQLEQSDLAAQAAATENRKTMPGATVSETAPSQITAYAPEAEPEALAASPGLSTAPAQPASMLSPQPVGGLGGLTPGAMTPSQIASLTDPRPTLPIGQRVPDQGGYNAIDAAANTDPWAGRSRAIAGIESGGAKDPYATTGAVTKTGDRAYGKYQVMGANVGPWTQAALGRTMTPQQFLGDKGAQEATFRNQFGNYVDKYGEEGAARAWYAGEGGMKNLGATDLYGRLNVGQYGQDYLKRLGQVPSGGPPEPRDAIAQALQPQQPPIMARGGDEEASVAPTALQASLAGPPAAAAENRPIPLTGAKPPVQVAQTRPAPDYGYVMPEPPPVKPFQPTAPSAIEQWAEDRKRKSAGNPYIVEDMNNVIAQEQAKRALADKAMNEEYTAQQTQRRELMLKREEQIATQARRRTEGQKEAEAVTKAEQENRLRAQFGNMPPDQVFERVNASRTIAKSAQQALIASQNAVKALEGGAILGSGANQRLDIAKFFHGIGLVDKGNAIANTEVFKSAMQPIVASILHQTAGSTQLSNADMAFAQRAAAGDITLDPQSIRRLLTIIDTRSKEIINDHQTLTGALFGKDNPQANALFGVEAPAAPVAPAIPEGRTATGPNGEKVIRRGGKWEPM